MNSAEVLIKFKADTSDVENKTKKFDGSMSGLTKSITLGNLAAKGIAKGFQSMSSHMGDAINRADTMKNFPKVMENMGISAKDSDKAIKTLSDKLTGLPTTLDSAASSVQRFTSKNGDVKKSTDLFLAVNDAILAGGAPMDQQASAMEQLSQAYAKGKPDMIEWKSIQNVMPAQLKQIATQMGYAGGNIEALGEDLRSGKVPMNDFMDAIVQLDKNGANGFKSFQEQAKTSTSGIRTSLTNLSTAITKGLSGALDELDKALQNAGLGGISGVIQKISKGISNVFKAIVPLIPKIITFVQWIVKLAPIWAPIVAGIIAYNAVMKIAQGVTMAMQVAQMLLNAAMMLNPIGLIIAAVVALIAIFVILWNKSEGFRNFWISAWETIKNAVITAWNFIKGVFTTVIDFIKNNWKQILLFLVNPFAGAFALLYKHNEKFRNAVNNLVNKVVGFFKSIPGKIKAIPGKMVSFFKSLPNKILNIFKSLPGKIKNVGLNIVKGIGRGITSGTTWIKNKIKEFTNNVKNSLKSFFGIESPSKWANEVIGQNISKGIAKGLKAKTVNWKNIGKQLGEQLKNGMADKVKDVKSIADSLKSNLSKIDLMSDGKLTDLSSIKDQVVQYGKNLSRLKGKIPADLYTEVLGMSREEGLDYTNQLLGLSNNELSSYVKNYKAIQKESQKISDAYYNEEVKKIKTQYTDKILGQLKTIEKNSKKLGKNATKGLINGMLSDIKDLDSASKSVASSIIKSIKKILKIKSPSRVMEQMGEYTTEGFINGITSMQDELNKVMSSSFDLSPNVVNSTSAHFSPNINVNVENNMTTDPLGQVVNKVKTFSGGAKNDYNYGR